MEEGGSVGRVERFVQCCLQLLGPVASYYNYIQLIFFLLNRNVVHVHVHI